MPRTLNGRKARQLTKIVPELGSTASFRNILRQAARAGLVRDNETLRIYLNLLVAGNALRVKTRDVGSVLPQQLYSMNSLTPEVSVGLGILRRHGLNWDVPETEVRLIRTDFCGLARAKIADSVLIASLEDCLFTSFIWTQ